jgi:CRISPR-associated endonuclease/helicase Cas3
VSNLKLYSHPHIESTLFQHLKRVEERAFENLKSYKIDYSSLGSSEDEFKRALKIATLCHDFGKSSKAFQEKLGTPKVVNGKFTVGKSVGSQFANHSEISAIFGYFVALELELSEKFASLIFLAIKKHHGDLGGEVDNFSVRNIYDIQKIWRDIKAFSSDEVDYIYKEFFNIDLVSDKFSAFLEEGEDDFSYIDDFEKEDYFLAVFLYSLLIYSDKKDAIFRENLPKNRDLNLEDISSIVDNFKSDKVKSSKPIDSIREKIYRFTVEKFLKLDTESNSIFHLNLPTGSGKTFLLLKLALILKEREPDRKIIYALPFIALIEQNAQIFRDVLKKRDLENSLFENHSLSSFEKNFSENDEYNHDKRDFLFDTFESDFIVTTFYQLFYSLFSNRNKMLKRFHKLANSIIVIDEIQAVNLNSIHSVGLFMKYLSESFGVKFIITTATLPKLENRKSLKEIELPKIEAILSSKEIESSFNRYRLIPKLQKSYQIDEFINQLMIPKLSDKRDMLIRLNRVDSVNYLYSELKKVYQNYGYSEIYILSSAIPPKIRLQQIEKIKESKELKIVIATQIIVAGVDISLDNGFEELAPLDTLVQSMGRRNRSGENSQKGEAEIIELINEKGEPLHKHIYPKESIEQTKEFLLSKISESEIYQKGLINSYFNRELSEKTDRTLSSLDFKEIRNSFKLIEEAPHQFSFFIAFDDLGKEIWNKYLKINREKTNLDRDTDFWKKMGELDEKYSKIKSSFSKYVVNINIYAPKSEKLMLDFEESGGVYFIDDRSEFFSKESGLDIKKYLYEELKKVSYEIW